MNVKLELKKNGLIVNESSREGNHLWNRLILFQWLTLISGWTYVIKAFVTVFFIDEHSQWNRYLGEWSPAIGK